MNIPVETFKTYPFCKTTQIWSIRCLPKIFAKMLEKGFYGSVAKLRCHDEIKLSNWLVLQVTRLIVTKQSVFYSKTSL